MSADQPKLPPGFAVDQSDGSIVKTLIPKDRVFERGRTCGNCLGFCPGEPAIKLWRDICVREDMERLKAQRGQPLWDPGLPQDDASHVALAKLMSTGMSLDAALDRLLSKQRKGRLSPRDQMRQKITVDINRGAFGLCNRGGVDNDGNPVMFIARNGLCHKWTGKDGASLATAGHPLDPLGDELRDLADSRAKPDPKKPTNKEPA